MNVPLRDVRLLVGQWEWAYRQANADLGGGPVDFGPFRPMNLDLSICKGIFYIVRSEAFTMHTAYQ